MLQLERGGRKVGGGKYRRDRKREKLDEEKNNKKNNITVSITRTNECKIEVLSLLTRYMHEMGLKCFNRWMGTLRVEVSPLNYGTLMLKECGMW